MDQHITFLLLGLANGAVFASLALALVVTYRSSGVVNFATGAIALVAAYEYAFLRQGKLLLILPGLPESIDLGSPLGFWPATIIAVVIASLAGLLLHLAVFRPMRNAPAVARAVASLGLMIAITGLIQLQLGTKPVVVPRIFPVGNLSIGDVRVSSDRLWIAATVVGIALVVGAVFQFTRFGLRTRAAAETEKGAFASGIAPDRIAALNWMISGAIAGVAGILIAPVAPLVPYSYTLFVVPALAAAIVGGFSRIGPAVAAGLVIGMLQSEMAFLKIKVSALRTFGVPELIPLIVVIVVLVLRAKPLPARGAVLTPTLGRAPRPTRLLSSTVVGAVIAVVGLVALHGTWRGALVTGFIFGIISLSSVVVTGYAGQVSLAQLTLGGVSGFLVATFTTSWGIPFPIAPLLAALGATVIGVVVGLPALRVRGLPLAIVTLSLAVTLQAVWFRNSDVVPSSGKDIVPPKLFGLDLGPGSGGDFPRLSFCFLVLAVLIAIGLGVAKLRTSRLGSAMLAVRANERAAAAAGINVVTTKLAAFAIGAFIAGIGGSLLGYKLGNVTWDSFDVLLGLSLFATTYLVGVTSVSGGVLAGMLGYGGIVFFALDRWIDIDEYWFQIASGLALVVTMVMNPEGIASAVHRRLRPRAAPDVDVRTPAAAPERARHRPPADAAPALSISGLGVRYGGVVALDDITFTVPPGTIVGLIGPNGAGKTTLVDAVTGFTRSRGTVELDRTSLDGLRPYQRTRAGLSRTFQGLELWGDLTVEENVMVGHGAGRRTDEELDQMYTLLGLDRSRTRVVDELSQGERQMVSIARSLVGNPAVLVLDEPAAGLDTFESEALGGRLRDIRDAGTTILLIDHDMDLVLNLCDEIRVLDFGKLIAAGTPDEIRSDRLVAEAYLGSTRTDHPTGTAAAS